jgi:hypothetical protein
VAADEKVNALARSLAHLDLQGNMGQRSVVFGSSADVVNGTYHPTDIYNDRVLFRKEGDGEKMAAVRGFC